jgi:hypothetical protein
MWRLSASALREGVKSTTRYRSKQPNKRGSRPGNPQRQVSGAKGGVAARRSANVRRSKRQHDYQYTARSVPSAFEPVYHHHHDVGSHDIPYPPSPYFGQHVDYVYGNHTNDHTKDFRESHARDGIDTWHTTQYPMLKGSAYVLSTSPDAPLFTDSPTPSAEEPRTPMSASGSGFGEMDLGQAQGWEAGNDGASGMGMGYQEYAG